ncbi:MAG TPA: DUF3488 and transglutaminase-like domain-containing protein [Jatrophihabitans sp.]|jgi:transglutaminase-like putative cysteine protease|uniref:transglutaminase TgpA family protein n=1 Tax=Jatrophihabitans sp. TaxID=1932789 RepID=UPI002E067FF1|nr:DUF3488 and transglutaminase-like domain-containing protein [Jatrophihabitans sp.]
MTATAARPVPHLDSRRTVLALTAGAIGMVPLKALFRDNGWLLDAWVSMAIVIGPALLLRLRRSPTALDVWPGIVLLVPWLTVRFVPTHAWFGMVPNRATWHDVTLLLTDLHHTTRSEIAPIHTTVAVRLVVCALLGLLAALIDLVAVVGRRGALAGVPLLVVYTVAGAVPRKPVHWVWFAFAAAGYLILLSLDAAGDLERWGRRLRAPGGPRAGRAIVVSTQRIGAVAIVAAIVLPLLVPGQPRNFIANAFHGGGGGIGGFGGSGGGSISPFAALKGQLDRSQRINLVDVHVDRPAGSTQPFYLRVNVLSKYDSSGWSAESHGATEPVDQTAFETEPADEGTDSVRMLARITIRGMTGNAPVFAVPRALNNVSEGTTWNPKDQLLLGTTVSRGQQISEQFDQPAPSLDALQAAPDIVDRTISDQLAVPSNFPAGARQLVQSIVKGIDSPYGRARAISDFFADPSNNFTYDLTTKAGDSGSDLVDFLQNRRGYCQQYAAAMAIMLRAAGVPARVVLGYMHPVPDSNGNFTITTADAHSWVEAHFSGIGWIPFDPTPIVGITGGLRNDLPQAPHVSPSASAAVPSTRSSSGGAVPSRNIQTRETDNATGAPKALTSPDQGLNAGWIVVPLLVLVLLAAMPASIRWRRRQHRYALARRDGDTDALWAELSDTATDLGYVWSPARSPRQVASWLARDLPESAGRLRELASAVEHARFAPAGTTTTTADLTVGLRGVTGELRAMRSGRDRLRAMLWPASLGWTRSRIRGVGRRRR